MTQNLRTDLNIADPDGFYELLVGLHDGLSEEQSRVLNAKLVLLLANHIGDAEVLRQALAAARQEIDDRQSATGSDQT